MAIVRSCANAITRVRVHTDHTSCAQTSVLSETINRGPVVHQYVGSADGHELVRVGEVAS